MALLGIGLGIGIVTGTILGMAIISLCVISKECEQWRDTNDKH